MHYVIAPTEKARTLAGNMDWRTLLDHASCPHFTPGQTPEKEYGAVFFHPTTRETHQQAIGQYTRFCNIKPLVTTDMEAGPGQMITDGTRFPSMMGCGKCNDEALAYQMGKAAALEGRAVGFNWSLAPCVDLYADIDNPIIGTRSAGSDPDHVIRITAAYLRGMQENGLIATLKHFPGDGYGTLDQHLTTSVNPLSKEEWLAKSGRVFQELIRAGAVAVMPGHIALPAFDTPDERRLYPPATLSKPLLADLLRGQLGFQGLIVSDAINMGGVVNFANYYDACALFWENGGDCLLFPDMDETFYREMEKRIEAGMLKLDTLRERVTRILSLKENLSLLDGNPPVAEPPDMELHAQWARQVAEGCLEVVRDRANVLPFKVTGQTKLLHLIVASEYEGSKTTFEAMTQALRAVVPDTHVMVDPGPDAIFEEVSKGNYSLIVCSIGAKVSYGVGTTRLYGAPARNMMKGWMRLGVPAVFIDHFQPTTYREFDAAMDTVINTYGTTPHSIRALMGRIFAGE